jgi:hypothetical protein
VLHHDEVQFTKHPSDLDYLNDLVERYDARLLICDPLSNHRRASIHRDELRWLTQSLPRS